MNSLAICIQWSYTSVQVGNSNGQLCGILRSPKLGYFFHDSIHHNECIPQMLAARAHQGSHRGEGERESVCSGDVRTLCNITYITQRKETELQNVNQVLKIPFISREMQSNYNYKHQAVLVFLATVR